MYLPFPHEFMEGKCECSSVFFFFFFFLLAVPQVQLAGALVACGDLSSLTRD